MTMDEAGLRRLIRRGEGDKLDFKARLDLATKDLKAQLVKHVLAIANTRGSLGYLVFGVDDQGNPTGQLKDRPTEEHIQQVIREYTEPYVETSYQLLSVNGVPVGLLTISRQAEKLPYRVAKPVGAGDKAILRDDIFYRYGRHSVKAQYSEMLDLMREGERVRRGLAAPPMTDPSLDPWRFLSRTARRAEMQHSLKRLLRKSLTLTREVVPTARAPASPVPACALAEVGGERFLTLWYIWPEDLSRTTLRGASHGAITSVKPKRLSTLATDSLMHFVLAYGNVSKSLLPSFPLTEAVLVTERFGLYLGPTETDVALAAAGRLILPIREPALCVKNVKSESLMAAAIKQCLDWLAQNSAHNPHLPFPSA